MAQMADLERAFHTILGKRMRQAIEASIQYEHIHVLDPRLYFMSARSNTL